MVQTSKFPHTNSSSCEILTYSAASSASAPLRTLQDNMAAAWSLVILLFLAASGSPGTFSDIRSTTVDPGFPRNASTNDPEVKKAMRITVYAFNNMSNDIYLSKELEIQKAMIQVVKGIKYMLLAKLARTVCKKNTEYILDQCEFQKGPSKKVFTCYSEVWKISWLHVEKVSVLECSQVPARPRTQDHRQLL